jgi:hypothetical protein
MLNLLFDKKKAINDPVLGFIKSDRIKGANQLKIYSWYASYLMPNAPEESTIVIEENHLQPSPDQLSKIKR